MSDLRHYSKEFLTEIIEMYKSFPCLWRVKSKEYMDKQLRAKAFDVLILKFKQVDIHATRDTVLKKINSLRNSWRKERNKVRESRKSGGDVRKPQLWYFNLLLFLEDQEISPQAVSNVTEVSMN